MPFKLESHPNKASNAVEWHDYWLMVQLHQWESTILIRAKIWSQKLWSKFEWWNNARLNVVTIHREPSLLGWCPTAGQILMKSHSDEPLGWAYSRWFTQAGQLVQRPVRGTRGLRQPGETHHQPLNNTMQSPLEWLTTLATQWVFRSMLIQLEGWAAVSKISPKYASVYPRSSVHTCSDPYSGHNHSNSRKYYSNRAVKAAETVPVTIGNKDQ
jgi:hypothetical protein